MDRFEHWYVVAMFALQEFGLAIAIVVAGIVWLVRWAMRRRVVM